MNTSFYTGLAGMKTQQFGIDVLSENIANVNTPGYKSSTVEFSTIFSKQLSGSLFNPAASDIGHGATVTATKTNFSAGSTIESENQFDMVIEGKGWFGLVNANNEQIYTRAGQFSKDANGFLVDANGNHVMGTSAKNVNADNSIIENPNTSIQLSDVGTQTPIQIPQNLTIPSIATTQIDFKGSLNPERIEEVSPTGEKVEVSNIEIYRSDVYDSEGNINKLEITFRKKVPQALASTTWDATATINDKNGNILSTQTGQLAFNDKGALTSNTLTSIDNNGNALALNFGTFFDTNIANSGYDGLVSLVGLNTGRSIQKNGNPSGTLLDYGIDSVGNIHATFSNGKTIPISKIAIYHFRNEEGLEKIGNTSFKESVNSGKAKFFADKNGNALQISGISNKKIEISNLDITTALSDLIVMQKAFDASSKSITTSDQMIQNAINMKR